MRLPTALSLTLALVSALSPTPLTAASETKRSAKGITYSIRIPDGYDRTKGALLVVGFHGWGGNNEELMRGLQAMSHLKEAILVTPNAPKAAAWEEADLEPVADLVSEVAREHRPPRTVAFGFSRGAYFSFGIGLRYPNLIHAVIPHSGGLVAPIPGEAAAKKQVFYVIHGDADRTVPVSQSREAVEKLKAAGLQHVKYDEVKGLAHRVDPEATKRAFAWIERTLGPALPALQDTDAAERLAALEKAIRAKDWDSAANGFGALAGASRRYHGKIASLAKTHVRSAHEPLALAAIEAASELGEAGVAVLKTVPATPETPAIAAAGALARTGSPAAAAALLVLLKGSPEAVAVAAAEALGELGGDASIVALIKGLEAAEGASAKAERRGATIESLKRLTDQTFATAREWKRWLAQPR